MEKFIKFDDDKIKPRLLQTRAIQEVLKLTNFGAKKYGENNWRLADDPNRYLDALGRHLFQYYSGEHIDEESGMNHLVHIAWNALSVIELLKDKNEYE